MAKGRLRVEFSAFFPMWGQLTAQQQAALCGGAFSRKVGKGEIMHSGDADCTGLLLVQSGQLRAFMLSPRGAGDNPVQAFPARPVPALRLLHDAVHPV